MSGYFDVKMGQWYPNEPVELGNCACCDAELYAGDEVLEFEGEHFCDMGCLTEHWAEIMDYTTKIMGDE